MLDRKNVNRVKLGNKERFDKPIHFIMKNYLYKMLMT